MAEFKSLLAFMDEDERSRAVRRYEQLFDQAGEDGAEELARSFGSPIRLVLQVEEEYRRAKQEGKIPFLDMAEPVPEQVDAVPPVEEQPGDIGLEVRQAADALADLPESDFPFLFREEENPISPVDEGFPMEETPFDDAGQDAEPLPPEDAGDEGADGEVITEMTSPEERPEEAASDRLEFNAAAESPAEIKTGSQAADTPPQPEESVSGFSDEDEEEAEEEEESNRSASPGAGRVFAAILVTVPFIALWIVGFALFLALGAAVMAAGFAACAAGVYFAGYVLSGMITFLPDMLLTAGGALGCFALALLLIWTGLWIAAGGCVCVVRLTRGAYRSILKKKRPEEDEEYE